MGLNLLNFERTLVCSIFLSTILLAESAHLKGGELRNLQQQKTTQSGDCTWFEGRQFCGVSESLSTKLMAQLPASQLKEKVEKVLVGKPSTHMQSSPGPMMQTLLKNM